MKYFDYKTRVRYSETDQLHVAYYGRYFEWFEAARVEYIRVLGISYATLEEKGYFLPVVEAQCAYHRPARYDDILVIKTSVNMMKNTSLRFYYEVFIEGQTEKLASGTTTHAFVDPSMKPIRIPELIREKIEVVSTPSA